MSFKKFKSYTDPLLLLLGLFLNLQLFQFQFQFPILLLHPFLFFVNLGPLLIKRVTWNDFQ